VGSIHVQLHVASNVCVLWVRVGSLHKPISKLWICSFAYSFSKLRRCIIRVWILPAVGVTAWETSEHIARRSENVWALIYFYGLVGAGVAQYSGCATGWTIWGSNPHKRKGGGVFSSPKRLNRPWGPHRLVFCGYGIYFPGCNVIQHLISRLERVEL